MARFSVQVIPDPEAPSGVHFRVTETNGDNRVATCYTDHNAALVCGALNALTELEPSLQAMQTPAEAEAQMRLYLAAAMNEASTRNAVRSLETRIEEIESFNARKKITGKVAGENLRDLITRVEVLEGRVNTWAQQSSDLRADVENAGIKTGSISPFDATATLYPLPGKVTPYIPRKKK